LEEQLAGTSFRKSVVELNDTSKEARPPIARTGSNRSVSSDASSRKQRIKELEERLGTTITVHRRSLESKERIKELENQLDSNITGQRKSVDSKERIKELEQQLDSSVTDQRRSLDSKERIKELEKQLDSSVADQRRSLDSKERIKELEKQLDSSVTDQRRSLESKERIKELEKQLDSSVTDHRRSLESKDQIKELETQLDASITDRRRSLDDEDKAEERTPMARTSSNKSISSEASSSRKQRIKELENRIRKKQQQEQIKQLEEQLKATKRQYKTEKESSLAAPVPSSIPIPNRANQKNSENLKKEAPVVSSIPDRSNQKITENVEKEAPVPSSIPNRYIQKDAENVNKELSAAAGPPFIPEGPNQKNTEDAKPMKEISPKDESPGQETESSAGEILAKEREIPAKEKEMSTKENEIPAKEKAPKILKQVPTRKIVLTARNNNQQGSQHLSYVKLLNFVALQRAEQDRSPLYTKQLKLLTEEWSKRQAILESLINEVKHANHLFEISGAAFYQYSQTMYAIHKDIFLDDEGNRVESSARRLILLKQRGGEDPTSTEQAPKSPKREGFKNSREKMNNVSYLDPLYKSFEVLTNTMMKVVNERESELGKPAAALEFLEFSEELLAQAEAIKALGQSTLQELASSESDVKTSFRKSSLIRLFLRGCNQSFTVCVISQHSPFPTNPAVSEVLNFLASKTKPSNSSFSIKLGQVKTEIVEKDFPTEMIYGCIRVDVGDWWLWETLYHAAVRHQQSTWNANQDRLQGVGDSIFFFKEKHHTKLKQAVLAIMPEQRELFLAGANAFRMGLTRTIGSSDVEKYTRLDHETMTKEFEAGVAKYSTSLQQKKTHHKSTILNRSRSKFNKKVLEQAEEERQLQEFGSPIDSKLVREAQVIERWGDEKEWTTTIAVFTVDRFLHLFDCADLDVKMLPQTAFKSMFPTTATSRASVHHLGGGRRRANVATKQKIPEPSFTFNLLTCTIKTYKYSGRSFELKQEVDPTVENDDDLPHAVLRFKNYQETFRWHRALLDMPDPDMPSPYCEPEAYVEEAGKTREDLYAEAEEALAELEAACFASAGMQDVSESSDGGDADIEDNSRRYSCERYRQDSSRRLDGSDRGSSGQDFSRRRDSSRMDGTSRKGGSSQMDGSTNRKGASSRMDGSNQMYYSTRMDESIRMDGSSQMDDSSRKDGSDADVRDNSRRYKSESYRRNDSGDSGDGFGDTSGNKIVEDMSERQSDGSGEAENESKNEGDDGMDEIPF